MTEQAVLAEMIRSIAESLCQFVESTDTAKLSWKPELSGSAPTRSILELVGECASVNNAFTALLYGAEKNTTRVTEIIPSSVEEVRVQLIESASKLAMAALSLSDDALERKYAHWRGPASGRSLLIGAYRNMAYHAGQVNLVQVLAGDAEFHLPTNWY